VYERFSSKTRTLCTSLLQRNSRGIIITQQIWWCLGNGSCRFKFPLQIQCLVQIPIKRCRTIFTLCKGHESKKRPVNQSRYLCKIYFEIDSQLLYNETSVLDFFNATVLKYLKLQGANLHTTQNPDINVAVIECFNKSLKTRKCEYITETTHRVTWTS
jgi:hypothetical protein